MAAISREPLSTATNGSNSPPPSPTIDNGRTARKAGSTSSPAPDHPRLRRKAPKQHLALDSSESYPSRDDSIYQASVLSNSDSTSGAAQYRQLDYLHWNATIPVDEPPSWSDTGFDAQGRAVPLSFLQPPPVQHLHQPHTLYPITEQSSLSTLRPPAIARSVRDKASNVTLSTQRSRSRSPGLNGMKRKSFSASDLPSTTTKSSWLRRSDSSSSPCSIPAAPGPNRPLRPAPIRSPTPPGLPSFGSPAAISYKLPPPSPSCSPGLRHSKLRAKIARRFRPPGPEMQEWRLQTVGLPKGVIMRGTDGTLVRGKFTPSMSGHTGPVRRSEHGAEGGRGPPMGIERAEAAGSTPTTGIGTAEPMMMSGAVRRASVRRSGDHEIPAVRYEYRDRSGGDLPPVVLDRADGQSVARERSGSAANVKGQNMSSGGRGSGARRDSGAKARREGSATGYRHRWSCCPCLYGSKGGLSVWGGLIPDRVL